MEIFENEIMEARSLIKRLQTKGSASTWLCKDIKPWPIGGGNRLVMAADTAVELGPPDLDSVSIVLLTSRPELVHDGAITLLGKDIKELAPARSPVAKILFAAVSGMTADNAYDIYLSVSLSRIDVSLQGYMVRMASHLHREWCRISKEAVNSGISLAHICRAEIEAAKKVHGVSGVEATVVTARAEDVAAFVPLARRTERIASAMCKLSFETYHECDKCDFSDLCSSVSGLKRLKRQKIPAGQDT